MKAKPITEYVILKLIYVPPHVEIDPPVVENFQTPRGPYGRGDPLLNWYYRVMSEEQSEIPKGNKVQFRMWRIKTHDANLFTIRNMRLEKLLLFVGEEKIYWMYYTPKPIFWCLEGVTALTLNYCCCCFHKQYLPFIKRIQEENKLPSGNNVS